MTKQISWLHLSDLHIGQSFQWLWPNFKAIFLDDIRRLTGEAGPIDLVVFSGDLTQRGDVKEFTTLSDELQDIWEELDKLGQRPLLFSVPGNHDLVRPAKNDARIKMLKQWAIDPDVSNEFWANSSNQYFNVVQAAFENYVHWYAGLKDRGIPVPEYVTGRLPGDISSSIVINDVSVGLIGLNTAFLQLDEEDFEGKLAIDLRQLNALTNNNPPAWCDQNQVNFLVTHHPTFWLSPEASRHFQSEIYPSGRFTAHLYGHMHEPDQTTIYRGGDRGRKTFQSSSLFGIEHLADGKTERAHGYAIGQIVLSDTDAIWKLWPRKGRVNRRSGDRRIVPDVDNFDLIAGKEFLVDQLILKQNHAARSIVIAAPKAVDLAATVDETAHLWEEALHGAIHTLTEQEQHLAIRPLQQQVCIESIRQKRMAWVCADWGLGRDGFLWSIAKRIGRETQPVYRVDLGNYLTRDEFLTRFATTAGCSFPDFCKALTSAGPSLLLLDEAPVSVGDQNERSVESDAEGLAMMLRDFCPSSVIMLLARRPPRTHSIDVVRLEPLDEADTRTYLLAHPAAGSEARSSRGVSEIFRHTDGLPGRIDRALGTLRVVSLSELGPPTSSDLTSSISSQDTIPMSLIKAVSELVDSNDPSERRSWLLLKVLAILPHGESLQRLKRIEHDNPIFPKHGEELLERDLIQIRTSATLIRHSEGAEDQVKILVAPRPVRDYVLSRMPQKEIDALVRKAASLYFGESWRVGHASLRKLDGPLTSDDGSLLQNPHFLVTRLLAAPSTWRTNESAAPVLDLCKIYTSALLEATNYRNCATVCRDALAIIPVDDFVAHRETLEILLAKSLRMLGEHDEARALYEKLLKNERPRDVKTSILLNYALCLQSLEDSSAMDVAKQVIALAPKSAAALQAQSIILEMQEEADSSAKLLKIEIEARKRGYDTVANNLVLSRTDTTTDNLEASSALKQVYLTATADDDPYTAARAMVKLAARSIRETGTIESGDLNHLISAYQYFYGERFSSLFSSAHKTLWNLFESHGDVRNLLSLFRHSSFIWRLHGDEAREEIYVKKLIGTARHILTTNVLSADQNTAYFLLRARDHATDEANGSIS
ncbi:metallophosphoesterase [Paraburkholderia antibiotica]|uniref:Tetratricopeptide repeat protein n=1 Tax=Paraburkholderia antibiotica TaxID=2728839 RepID=A0A7Y0A2F0_9BURK|nr:metallophosphoesterase [Paraburkholderia antibiotica]NML35188.1 tetratricopeptide repeat protein [Paraburkholderia antibiotica]